MDEILGECVNDPDQRPGPVSRLGSQISGGDDEERWHIFVTGHSMGGAKATLCAYELAVSRTQSLVPVYLVGQTVCSQRLPPASACRAAQRPCLSSTATGLCACRMGASIHSAQFSLKRYHLGERPATSGVGVWLLHEWPKGDLHACKRASVYLVDSCSILQS